MIFKSGLRIGNMVLFDGVPVRIESIDTWLNDYHPIALSDDLLKRCGQEYVREDKNWEYQIIVGAIKWYFRWNTEWYSELGGIYLGSHIQYLHQVQNIYYDLTDKELTINK